MTSQTATFTLVALYGVTGVGKTVTSLRLAKKLRCPIISSDSRQCYREMRIGTAQPTVEEREQAPHYFVASHSITERFSAGQFELEALAVIESLQRAGERVAILTGGSMLYMDALIHGLDNFPVPDAALRARLSQQLEAEGVAALFAQLLQVDPVTAKRIDPCNGARVLRALEVSLQTGRPYSALLTRLATQRPFRVVEVGIERPLPELHQRINARVEAMRADGLEDEARALFPYRSLPPLQTVGYQELFAYFDGRCSRDQAFEQIKLHTRQYARRQSKWWRRNGAIRWFAPEDEAGLWAVLEKSLQL